MKKTLGVIAVVAVILLGLVAYYRVGWSRMVDACPVKPLTGNHASSSGVRYSWSWNSPVGFTCTYTDGETRTSLWF